MTMRSREGILPVNKGLLWKEWRQNRLYFLAAFLIMSYDPTIKTLMYLIKGLLKPEAGTYAAVHWLNNINMLSAPYRNSMEQTGIIIAILLGVVLLFQERSGSLNYLVSTPVSRRDIIIAKFLTGGAAIAGIMVINALFMIIVGLLFPVYYSAEVVFKWSILTTAAFLALFSLGLCIASITGHVLSSLFLAFLFPNLPLMLGSMFTHPVIKQTFDFSPAFLLKVNMIAHYLTIPAYITRNTDYTEAEAIVKFFPNYPLETCLLMALTGLMIFLAVKIFQKNHLENNGQMFIPDQAVGIAQIFVAAIIAVSNTSTDVTTISGFLGRMVITFIIAYLVIILLSAAVYYLKKGIGYKESSE